VSHEKWTRTKRVAMAKYTERSGEEMNKKQNDIVITLLPIFLIPPENKRKKENAKNETLKKMYHSKREWNRRKTTMYHIALFIFITKSIT
jgi:hypothetical protein